MKYEFTGETKEVPGGTLKRIRALVTIGLSASAGDVGGWVESEENLSQASGDARVSEKTLCSFTGFGSENRLTEGAK